MNTIYLVTPSFNSKSTIDQTILSVVSQAGDFELFYHIQDGQSNDETVEILRRWQSAIHDKRVQTFCRRVVFSFESLPDSGIYDAVTRGFNKFHMLPDSFMGWINSDDILLPGALACVSKVANSFNRDQASWISGATSVLKDDMHIAHGERPTPNYALKNGMCDGIHWHFLQQEGTFFRRWLWDAADSEKILKNYRLAGDWNLWRVFAHHTELVEVPWALGSFRLRQGQLSQVGANDYAAEINRTVPIEMRRAALEYLGNNGAPMRRILTAHWPSGKLSIVERTSIAAMFDRYKRVFEKRPACPYDDKRTSFILFEGNDSVTIDQVQANNKSTNCYFVVTPSLNVVETIDKTIASVINQAGGGVPPKPEYFNNYTYARRTHWKFFEGLDVELFGRKRDLDAEQLKVYQDLLTLRFIRDNIPSGARILDVGGGISRILAHLADTYECWNIDKLEGVGNGPRTLENPPYRLIRDYIGNFNPELPDNYFDFVFSISALEHVPQGDTTLFENIITDINRVLKPGGFSLHLFDIVLKQNAFWTNEFTDYIFSKVSTLNKAATPAEMRQDPDFYAMSELAYNKTWHHSTKKPYVEHGLPSSLNILWRKDACNKSAEFATDHTHTEIIAPAGSHRFFVVTPCLNAASTIDKTIQSVISQSGGFSVRYHVQDGGSNDGTLEKLRHWSDVIKKNEAYKNVRFSWSSAPDAGMYDALRAGFDSLEMAPDDFMTWINGDDMLMPDALSAVAGLSSSNPSTQWIGGTARVIDMNDEVVKEIDIPAPNEVIREGLCDGQHWAHLQQEGMFFRKSLWFRAKHALVGFRLAGDWSLWRAFALHAKYHQLDRPLGAFRRRPGQLSVARRTEYDTEIASALPVEQRTAAFRRLYAQRQSIQYIVVRMADATAAPSVEKKTAANYFESFDRRMRGLTESAILRRKVP